MRRRSIGRTLMPVGLSALLALLAVAPVSAVQYSSESYSWNDSGSYECGDGNWVDWAAEGTGMLSIRAGTGDQAGAFFVHDRYQWHSTDVRRSDGLALHFGGHGTTKETRAVHLAGSVFEFTSVDAGQSWVKDADGTVIVHSSGSIRETIRFDTLGDDEPGGEFITSVSVRANGQHADFDSCSIFGE